MTNAREGWLTRAELENIQRNLKANSYTTLPMLERLCRMALAALEQEQLREITEAAQGLLTVLECLPQLTVTQRVEALETAKLKLRKALPTPPKEA